MTADRRWAFWGFIAVLVILDFTLHLALGLGAAAPDLLTVAVLLGARRLSGVAAASLGLVLGVLRDALSLVAFGAEAVALTVVAYLGARSRDFFIGESLAFVALYLFLGAWLHGAIYYFIAGEAGHGGWIARLLVEAPIGAAYAAAAGVVALLVYRLITGER